MFSEIVECVLLTGKGQIHHLAEQSYLRSTWRGHFAGWTEAEHDIQIWEDLVALTVGAGMLSDIKNGVMVWDWKTGCLLWVSMSLISSGQTISLNALRLFI